MNDSVNIEPKNLSKLKVGETGRILKIDVPSQNGEVLTRLLELGFIEGQTVTVFQKAMLGDPIAVDLHQTRIGLRKSEAENIQVVPIDRTYDE